jgi:hypothetical protein
VKIRTGLNNEPAWFLATSPEPRLRDAALAVWRAKKADTAGWESAAYRNTLAVAHYRNGDDKSAVTGTRDGDQPAGERQLL